MKRFSVSAFIFLATSVCLFDRTIAQAQTVDYQRDIQPILAEHCTACHGGDDVTRQGGLRLDIREVALKGGDSGTPAIVPGKPDISALIRRITSTDPAEVMPPPKE